MSVFVKIIQLLLLKSSLQLFLTQCGTKMQKKIVISKTLHNQS